MIDVLIPVLGRPYSAERVSEAVHSNTKADHRIVFICSSGDDAQIEACLSTGDDVIVMSGAPGPHDYPLKMNAAFRDTDGEWLLLGADDIEPVPGWEDEALRRAGSRFHVIATNDKANGQVMRGLFGTHCLVRRSYIADRGGHAGGHPNILIYEGYDHNFCDRELCGVAQHRGVYVFEKHSVIRHYHPNWRTAQNDDTYRKGRANYKADFQLFLQRSYLWEYEGLTPGEKRHAVKDDRRGRGRRR